MSIKMKVECPKESCKFKDRCTLRRKGGNEVDFTPTLKIRMIGLKLTVQCFSFKEEGDEDKYF
jgi:hypothetical protein